MPVGSAWWKSYLHDDKPHDDAMTDVMMTDLCLPKMSKSAGNQKESRPGISPSFVLRISAPPYKMMANDVVVVVDATPTSASLQQNGLKQGYKM